MTNPDWSFRVRLNGISAKYLFRSATLLFLGTVCVAVAQRAGVSMASILPDSWNEYAQIR
jgi:hypothetical protein